jgi:hypothetical protein
MEFHKGNNIPILADMILFVNDSTKEKPAGQRELFACQRVAQV